jgi:membrane associated rhomboid family serine protease
MTISLLTIIIAATGIISYNAFTNRLLMDKMIYSPYRCKHNNEFYRTITHLFVHADWTHLLFNMMSLYFLGNVFLSAPPDTYVEISAGLIESYGYLPGQFHLFVLYFAGGLFATLIPYFRNKDNPNYLALGASGAVSSVIFAAIIWNPEMPLGLFFIPIRIPAYIFGPLYIAFEIYMDKRGNSNIAHDAHIGGAIFGIVYVLFLNFDKAKELVNLVF